MKAYFFLFLNAVWRLRFQQAVFCVSVTDGQRIPASQRFSNRLACHIFQRRMP
jgi:hypothetical protein